MAINYTKEQTKHIVEEYSNKPTKETVDMLANYTGKSSKSIIGKLAREGVYQKQIYVSKTGEKPVTKIELVKEIAENLQLTETQLYGLEKSPKGVLKLLCENI